MKINIEKRRHSTPLHDITVLRDGKEIKRYIEKGIDINTQDRFGDTPLHVAVKGCCVEGVKALIEAGADVTIVDNAGLLPIENIDWSRFDEARKESLRGNSKAFDKINEIDRMLTDARNYVYDAKKRGKVTGVTELHRIVSLGAPEDMIKEVIELGADINAKDSNGDTPLHIAVRNFKRESVKALLQEGADFTLRNNMGETPSKEAYFLGLEYYRSREEKNNIWDIDAMLRKKKSEARDRAIRAHLDKKKTTLPRRGLLGIFKGLQRSVFMSKKPPVKGGDVYGD